MSVEKISFLGQVSYKFDNLLFDEEFHLFYQADSNFLRVYGPFIGKSVLLSKINLALS